MQAQRIQNLFLKDYSFQPTASSETGLKVKNLAVWSIMTETCAVIARSGFCDKAISNATLGIASAHHVSQ